MSTMEERKEKIISFMKEGQYKPLLFNELAIILNVPQKDMNLFESLIKELEEEGEIIKTKKKRYIHPQKLNLYRGRIQGNERGFAFFIPDDEKVNDFFIPANALNGAMHKDKAMVKLSRKVSSNKKAEGEVIKVLERANTKVVGTFEKSNNFGFLVPDDKRISGDIFIPSGKMKSAKSGQKVVVTIEKWPEARRNAEGAITEIIGDKGKPGVDILCIIKEHGLNEEFPEKVNNHTESINETITKKSIEDRKDFRNIKMITIDGEDAKDLDDAVSIEPLENNCFRLGVHIADVSNYVTKNSPLDREALKRGTSVYLVDRVIPMLPKKLSNGICSLNPKTDRLCLSVIMDVDSFGEVYKHKICESVINIDERMNYTDVFRIIEEKDKDLKKKYQHIYKDLQNMRKLCEILTAKRQKRGAIDFDFGESKVTLDERGYAIDVKKSELTIANRIIEEFMILCNETVAQKFFEKQIPFVYRTHEKPDSEKIEAFSKLVQRFGYKIKNTKKIHSKNLQNLLSKIKGQKEENLISNIMLRSLKKAKYSHINHGHFGLASSNYCHFTSPIRRYPDLMIHRIIKEHIHNKLTPNKRRLLEKSLPNICTICSDREREAEEAERETIELKKAEYMKNYIGEVFTGVISGVTSFGVFVQLDNTVEGMVDIYNMEYDDYFFNENDYSLTGHYTNKNYRIGDIVDVIVLKVDVSLRRIDFVFVENNKGFNEKAKKNSKAKKKRRKKRRK